MFFFFTVDLRMRKWNWKEEEEKRQEETTRRCGVESTTSRTATSGWVLYISFFSVLSVRSQRSWVCVCVCVFACPGTCAHGRAEWERKRGTAGPISSLSLFYSTHILVGYTRDLLESLPPSSLHMGICFVYYVIRFSSCFCGPLLLLY